MDSGASSVTAGGPRWQCRSCRAPLELAQASPPGEDSGTSSSPASSPAQGARLVAPKGNELASLASSRSALGQSYVVLPQGPLDSSSVAVPGASTTSSSSSSTSTSTTTGSPGPAPAPVSAPGRGRGRGREQPPKPRPQGQTRQGPPPGTSSNTNGLHVVPRLPISRAEADCRAPAGAATALSSARSTGDGAVPVPGAGALEESFVVLAPDADTPAPPAGGVAASSPITVQQQQQHSAHTPGRVPAPAAVHAGASDMGTAGMAYGGGRKTDFKGGGDPLLGPMTAGASLDPGDGGDPAGRSAGLHKRLAALEKVFQLVSSHMQVALPLCLECAALTCQEMEQSCREAEADIAAYQAALAALRMEAPPSASEPVRDPNAPGSCDGDTPTSSGISPTSHAPTSREPQAHPKAQALAQAQAQPQADRGPGDRREGGSCGGGPGQGRGSEQEGAQGRSGGTQSGAEAEGEGEGDRDAEEHRLEAELEALLVERERAQMQLEEMERRRRDLDAAEERYWDEVNELMYRITDHQGAREGVLARIEVCSAQLESLRNLSVLNDAFHIWHDKDFGTISNFRLGRLPSVPVDWSEINAAWGQACHLLHTIAQICGCQLTCQIVPMGSYPKIIHGKTLYELSGPVNLFWSARYDQAMVLFLKCLKELAEFANSKDRAVPLPPDKCFQLPYKIQDDKVNDHTIKQSFNRDSSWTKALKYMLCDLKWLQVWVINRNQVQLPHASSAPIVVGVGH